MTFWVQLEDCESLKGSKLHRHNFLANFKQILNVKKNKKKTVGIIEKCKSLFYGIFSERSKKA